MVFRVEKVTSKLSLKFETKLKLNKLFFFSVHMVMGHGHIHSDKNPHLPPQRMVILEEKLELLKNDQLNWYRQFK